MFGSWPQGVREPLIDWHLRSLTKTLQELPASQRTGKSSFSTELRNGGNLLDVPLIVLCALGIDPFMAAIIPESYQRKMKDGQSVPETVQAASGPRGDDREAAKPGHDTIHKVRIEPT